MSIESLIIGEQIYLKSGNNSGKQSAFLRDISVHLLLEKHVYILS